MLIERKIRMFGYFIESMIVVLVVIVVVWPESTGKGLHLIYNDVLIGWHQVN